MALVAWYKLDGNANDSSGNNLNGTANNISWVDGKIGQCGSFNGNNGRIEIQNMVLPGDKSISLWVKVDTIPSDSRIMYIHATSKIGLGFYNGNSFVLTSGGNSQRVGLLTGFVTESWNHICVTYSLNNIPTLYINGSEGTYSGSNHWTASSDTFYIGGRENGSYFNGLIDDIRIYDHALSAKEVKELSQAKILHYKFDDFQEPTINVVPDGDFKTKTFQTPYLSAARGTLEFVDGAGVNGGVALKHIASDGDSYTTPYSGSSSAVLASASPGQTWTASVYCRSETGSVPCQLYIFALTSGYTYSTGIISKFFTATTQYQRFTLTLSNLPSDTLYISTRVDNDGGAGAVVYWSRWQLEQKDYATPFVNGSRTGTVLDTSGYDNHAELDSNTPQWVEECNVGTGSYYFNGVNTITTNKLFLDNINQSHTVSARVYPTNPSYSGNQQLINFNLGYRIYHNAGGQSLMYNNSGANDHYVYGSTIPSNIWTHIAWVYDTDNLICKVYYNGVLNANSSNFGASDIPSGFATSTIFGTNYVGNLDDVRIYATALSEDDIQELYASRATLDENGNLSVYKAEVIKTEETKTGETLYFDNAWDYYVEDILVSGNSEQVQTVQGKNLCGYNGSLPYVGHGVTMTYNNGLYTIQGTSTAYPYKSIYTIKANTLVDGTYYLSRKNISGTGFPPVRIVDRTVSPAVVRTSNSEASLVISGGHNDLLIEIACGLNLAHDASFYIQLEKGSVATAYEPFIPNSPSPDYPSPVLSAGECNLVSRTLNMIENGNFANGTTGWTLSGFTVNSIHNATLNVLSKKASAYASVSFICSAGDKLYQSSFVKADSPDVKCGNVWNGSYKSHSGSGNFERLSIINTALSASNAFSIVDFRASDWTQVSFKCPVFVNLTKAFGAGNEPSKEWCDLHFAKWQDKKSMQSALPTLRKIGDLADTFNPVTGEYVQRIGVKVFDGTEELRKTSNPPHINTTNNMINTCIDLPGLNPSFLGFSTHNIHAYVSQLVEGINRINNYIWITLSFERLGYTSEDDARPLVNAYLAAQYAAGTPVEVYYQLATPVTTYLTPIEIPTYYPNTVIEVDGAVQPSITATVYTYNDEG